MQLLFPEAAKCRCAEKAITAFTHDSRLTTAEKPRPLIIFAP